MAKELRMDDLEIVTGGSWNFDTLTSEELDEYNALEDARLEADMAGDWTKVNALETQINAFIDRMDLKYGA